ncbi:hypothetical protein DCCM_3839 [Desulfocucumis palustris]|uniref:Uncharacterized protein n=1 Tax=Desulfocucumis palustris TaxID=1898651 RepID=A0A2L2XEC3_9FIRM|nr:hypothetical protein [Desulfocucumis palustris]GBF34719.1 hypothetical protein DCCM_3839 [Desulfocucumis palustris]
MSRTVPGRPPAPAAGEIYAAILEYLSMFPSIALLIELTPVRLPFLDRLADLPVICLPMFLRLWISRLCPGYDPHLSAWPRTARDYLAREIPPGRRRRRIQRLLEERRWLDAYEFWWACRRPATRKRLTLPLYNFLGGDNRPFWATTGVFALSGLLHALWYPLFPLYAWLSVYHMAFKVFISLWLGYILLGIPVAINKKLKKGARFVAR